MMKHRTTSLTLGTPALLTLMLTSTIALADPPAKNVPLDILQSPVSNVHGETCDWPAVVMQDDLNALQQRAVINDLGRRFEDFTKEGIYASVLIPRPTKKSAKDGVFRIYSYYFTVHADLEELGDENLLSKLFANDDQNDGKGEGKDLGVIGSDKYSYAEEPALMDRVKLTMVLRSNDTKTEKSVYAGSIVVTEDPDKTVKSTWAMADAPDETHLYKGMGIYTKATPLAELPQVLFFEAHMVFYEPRDWFRGKNLLGSKLPIMIQDQVRSLRRELAR